MLSKPFIENYFLAEKQAGVLFMITGILGIILAVILLIVLKSSFVRGMAIPLIAIGVIQFIVGFTVHRRSDQQRSDIVYAFDLDPAKLRNEELPRMEKVTKSFKPIMIAEVVLLVAGLVLFFVFRNQETGIFWYGIGFALASEAIVSLIMDYFAEKRAHEYLEALRSYFKI